MIKKVLKQDKQALFMPLLNRVNSGRNYEAKSLRDNISSTKDSIKYYTKEIANYKKIIKEKEAKLSTIKVQDWTIEDLFKSIDSIAKHKDVEWAFITKDFYLVVQTKPLLQYDAIEEKQLDEIVGRYAFRINLQTYAVEVQPLDFLSQGYRHPHVMTAPYSICWGNVSGLLNNTIKSGELYNAVDTLIVFFSTFPQVEGGGHRARYWLVWLYYRQLSFTKNPWMKLKPIHTIGKVVEPKEKKFKINRVAIGKEQGHEYDLNGLNFRNY